MFNKTTEQQLIKELSYMKGDIILREKNELNLNELNQVTGGGSFLIYKPKRNEHKSAEDMDYVLGRINAIGRKIKEKYFH